MNLADHAALSSNSSISFKAIVHKILPLALPMTVIQLVTFGSGFLCMMMMSRLGHQVLAASALIFSTQMTVMAISMSMLFSLSVLIGHAYGAGNNSEIGNFLQQGWTFALIIAIPVILLFWHVDKLLLIVGQEKTIVAIVQTYFHAYVWAVVPLFLMACNQQFCYGVHKQKLVMFTSALGVIILLVTAYNLIFGKIGLPALGVAGLGYAMAAQAWSVFLLMILSFCYFEFFKRFQLFNYRVHKNWQHLKKMFHIGWPISVQVGGEMLSVFACAAMVGWLGTNSLAAYQVVSQYFFLIIVPIFSLSQASGILVGQAKGGQQFDKIKKLGHVSVYLALLLGSIAALMFLLFPRWLAAFYFDVHNPIYATTLHLVILLFAVTAFNLLLDAVRNVITGALRGLFDTKFPMMVGLIVIWLIGIPLGYVMAFQWHWGVVGISLGSGIGVLLGAIVVLYRWHILCKQYHH